MPRSTCVFRCRRVASANEGWICERHTDQPWPHEDCPGPRILRRADVSLPNRSTPVKTRTGLVCPRCRQPIATIDNEGPTLRNLDGVRRIRRCHSLPAIKSGHISARKTIDPEGPLWSAVLAATYQTNA